MMFLKENELKNAVDIALKRGADYMKFCDQEEKMLTYKKGALNFDTTQLKTLVEHCNIHKLRTNIHHITLKAFRKSLQSGVSNLAHLPLDKEFSAEDIDVLRNSNTMQLLLENGLMDKIAFGNDSGASQCSPATRDAEIDMFSLCAKKAGFNDTQISAALIRMFTVNAAKSLGIEKDYGLIEVNKNADLAIYPANPLENSALLKTEVDALIMDGQFFMNNQGIKAKNI